MSLFHDNLDDLVAEWRKNLLINYLLSQETRTVTTAGVAHV